LESSRLSNVKAAKAGRGIHSAQPMRKRMELEKFWGVEIFSRDFNE
jgi:hypothetical protein